MTLGQRLSTLTETAKPYVGGAVVGAAAITVIGFSADWVVGAGTLQDEVHQARVNALAAVCAREARQHWTVEENKKLSALEGWNNDKRDQLAKTFSVNVADWKVEADVTDRCDDRLRDLLEEA